MMILKLRMLFFAGLAVFALAGCTKVPEVDSNDLMDKIVVEGYVFANEPVEKVAISRVNASGNSELIPVSNAQVEIMQGNTIIQLDDSDSSAGNYFQKDSSSFLTPGEGPINLKVILAGKTYSSNTSFPEKISGLQISNSQIDLIPGDDVVTVATLSWDSLPNAVGYCLFIRNAGTDYTLISQEGTYTNVFHRINHSSTLDLKSTDFSSTGNFDIYVTAVNQDYAEMYKTTGSNNLISGENNINSGWGIFTAFNGEAVSVSVQ